MSESVTGFVKTLYKGKPRKGINKDYFEHMLDVVDNSYIEKIDDTKRSAKIMKAGLLHDVPEDTKMDVKELQKRLSLSDDLIETLKRLSRNIPNEDKTGYLEGILKDEDALIVKLADRISNLKDLILWLHNDDGMNKASKKIADKYLKEDDELLLGVKKLFPKLLRDNADSPIANQYIKVKQLNIDLKKLYDRYKDKPLLEGMFKDYSVENGNFDIKPEDISRTYSVILDMWKHSKELQESYPDYPQRLKKAMSSLEKKIETKGFSYVKSLFDKVKFDEDNFVKLYEEYLQERLLKSIDKLQSRREQTPKDGTIAAIAKITKISIKDIFDKAESTNKDDVKWVYDNLTTIMDKNFDEVKDQLGKFATEEGGEFIFRPDKYKDFNRAFEKFVKDMKDPKENVGDFLDLGDILGFRGRFSDVDGVINFALSIIENTDYSVYKFKSYVGGGTAYQGINMNMNYEGEFNFECQSVMDQVQIATDLNHDIFYKNIMKVNAEQKKAVAMLVQIFIGYMFSEIFDFGKKV